MLFNCDVFVLEYTLGSKYTRRPLEEYWIKQARKKMYNVGAEKSESLGSLGGETTFVHELDMNLTNE